MAVTVVVGSKDAFAGADNYREQKARDRSPIWAIASSSSRPRWSNIRASDRKRACRMVGRSIASRAEVVAGLGWGEVGAELKVVVELNVKVREVGPYKYKYPLNIHYSRLSQLSLNACENDTNY